jgi:hypothetical protein
MNPIIVLAIALRMFVIPAVATALDGLDGLDGLVLPIVTAWIVLALLLGVGFARVGLQRPKRIDA